eukprot:m.79244 g.79244  ORF g.79244 m.79244 type:complete len:112 (-) comp8599_c0_seq1:2999-3334(-)
MDMEMEMEMGGISEDAEEDMANFSFLCTVCRNPLVSASTTFQHPNLKVTVCDECCEDILKVDTKDGSHCTWCGKANSDDCHEKSTSSSSSSSHTHENTHLNMHSMVESFIL